MQPCVPSTWVSSVFCGFYWCCLEARGVNCVKLRFARYWKKLTLLYFGFCNITVDGGMNHNLMT